MSHAMKSLLVTMLLTASGPAYAEMTSYGPQCDAIAASPLDLDLPDGIEGAAFDRMEAVDQAVETCLFAAAQDGGERRYLTNLGRLFAKRGEYNKALESYRLAHGRGSAVAAHNLGAMYAQGHGVVESQSKAVRYFRKAAHRGLAASMVILGDRARFGEGMPDNPKMSVFWYEKAAEIGDAAGLTELGVMRQNGWGIRQDNPRALSLFKQALKNDPTYAKAAMNLGEAFETGIGTDIDLLKAREYFERAAENGNGNAANEVGRFYAEGLGVEIDPVQAAEWYARGAAMGWVVPTISLAEAYESGFGVPTDLIEARRLYEIAYELTPDEQHRAHIKDLIRHFPTAPLSGGVTEQTN